MPTGKTGNTSLNHLRRHWAVSKGRGSELANWFRVVVVLASTLYSLYQKQFWQRPAGPNHHEPQHANFLGLMDILISEEMNSPFVEALKRKYEVVSDGTLWKNPNLLGKRIHDAKAIMVRNQTQVTARLLAAAPRLIAIGRVGVGLDNIDVGAATNEGIVVVAPLEANATSVAELTIGLMLSLARKISLADRSTKAGSWDRRACMGFELKGKTLAICGFGRIGRLVGKVARSLAMKLVVFDPYVKADSPALAELEAISCAKLSDALAQADFVTVHLPLTPGTKRLFNTRIFAVMKPGAYFINTSRGGVVDERALLAALKKGRVAGAALDVRGTEPPGKTAFDDLNNVILTPHIGSFTVEAQGRTFQAVCDDIDRLLEGKTAVNYINFASPRKNEAVP
jgi:D-3-phosphoglycerate dehydrogenase